MSMSRAPIGASFALRAVVLLGAALGNAARVAVDALRPLPPNEERSARARTRRNRWHVRRKPRTCVAIEKRRARKRRNQMRHKARCRG